MVGSTWGKDAIPGDTIVDEKGNIDRERLGGIVCGHVSALTGAPMMPGGLSCTEAERVTEETQLHHTPGDPEGAVAQNSVGHPVGE